MRAFIVLCLVAFASADHLGYNYRPVDQSYTPGGSSSGNGGLGSGSAPGASFAGLGSGPSFGGSSSGPSFGGSSAGPSFGGSSSGPSFGGSSGAPGAGDLGSASNSAPVGAPELEKEFYTFTADEQDFNEPAASSQYANSVKQGLRVVFIKGPENNGLEDAALALAKQAADQHTAIYVLNKQTDLNDLANKLNQATSNNNNKPEVHFVKYRTPEDAANAQRAIQGQYDSLGGPSQNIDGGVAPALNFASQAPVAPAGHHGGAGPQGSYGQQSSFAPQSAFAPQGSFGSHGSSAPGSFGSHGSSAPGSFGSQGSFAPQGSFGSHGVGSSPSGSVAGGPGATYLPASIFRRFRL